MITVITLLIIIAFVAAVLHVMGKCPLWVAVFMLCLIELLRVLPLGH